MLIISCVVRLGQILIQMENMTKGIVHVPHIIFAYGFDGTGHGGVLISAGVLPIFCIL